MGDGGCCGSFFKMIFTIVNVLFFIMGVVIFITAAVLKWTGLFNKFLNIPEIETLVKLGSLGHISTALLVIGAFIILLSVFGLIGARCDIKFFLVIYEIIVILLFLALGVSLLVLVFSSSSIEKSYNKALTEIVDDINDNKDPGDKKCDIMKSLSEIFDCCGSQSPAEFNVTVRTKCCPDYKKDEGCGPRSISLIKKNSVNFLIIPSCVILAIELFAMIIVCQMIRSNGKSGSGRYSDNS